MKLTNCDVRSFAQAFYEGQCSACGQKLVWQPQTDDALHYLALCCARVYHMRAHTVQIVVVGVPKSVPLTATT